MLMLIFVVPLIRRLHFAGGPVETLAVIRTLATKCCYRDRNESLRCGRFRVGNVIWQVVCISLMSGGRPSRPPPTVGVYKSLQ